MSLLQKKINLKFRFLDQNFRKTPFNLLDVGAGNHAASRTTRLFPNCNYYGLDLTKEYGNNDSDFKAMKGFFEIDLTKLDYSVIPDNYFDGMLMVHVIEHLYNGDLVLPLLLTKLKPGGHLYIEYPGIKSTRLPSMYGTLNFKDDPTHVRLYSINELKKIFEENNCSVIKSGTRRNYYYIIAMPFRIIYSLIKIGKLQGNLFWDLLGFAEYLQVQKNK